MAAVPHDLAFGNVAKDVAFTANSGRQIVASQLSAAVANGITASFPPDSNATFRTFYIGLLHGPTTTLTAGQNINAYWGSVNNGSLYTNYLTITPEEIKTFAVPYVISNIVASASVSPPITRVPKPLNFYIETYNANTAAWETRPGSVMPNSDTSIPTGINNGNWNAWMVGYQIEVPLQPNEQFRIRVESNRSGTSTTISLGYTWVLNVLVNCPAW